MSLLIHLLCHYSHLLYLLCSQFLILAFLLEEFVRATSLLVRLVAHDKIWELSDPLIGIRKTIPDSETITNELEHSQPNYLKRELDSKTERAEHVDTSCIPKNIYASKYVHVHAL